MRMEPPFWRDLHHGNRGTRSEPDPAVLAWLDMLLMMHPYSRILFMSTQTHKQGEGRVNSQWALTAESVAHTLNPGWTDGSLQDTAVKCGSHLNPTWTNGSLER